MKIEIKKSTAHIILDDEASLNALSLEKIKELKKLSSNRNIKLVLCRGMGRVFCSGGNLHEYAQLKTKTQGLKVHREIRQTLDLFSRMPALKVAYVAGDCYGGGIEFLSCFDRITSAPYSLFAFWQNKLSLSYGWGGYKRLSRRLCPHFLKNALLGEEIHTAQSILQKGLIDRLLLAEEVESYFSQLEKWMDNSKSKMLIARDLEKNEVLLFEKLWGSEEHLAHLNKFTNHL